MARTTVAALGDGRVWSLLLEERSYKCLREGGFFAGHNLKEDLKTELRRQFWEQEQSQEGETLSHYLTAQPSANSSTSTSSLVKYTTASKRRKVSRDLASLQILDREHELSRDLASLQILDREHEVTTSSLPVSHSTRSAQKKFKLVAAEKQRLARLATTARRRLLAAQKKRKLADMHKLDSVGMRKIVTRSSHN